MNVKGQVSSYLPKTYLSSSQHFLERYLLPNNVKHVKNFLQNFKMLPFLSKAHFQSYHVGINEKRFVALIEINNFFWLRFLLQIVEIKIELKCWFSQSQGRAGWYNSPPIHNRVKKCDYITNYTTNILIKLTQIKDPQTSSRTFGFQSGLCYGNLKTNNSKTGATPWCGR